MPEERVGERVSRRLRELREAQQLSVRELARRSSVPAEVLSRAERGLRTPTLETLGRICTGLGISLREFFDDSRTHRPTKGSEVHGALRQVESVLAKLDPVAQKVAADGILVVARSMVTVAGSTRR